MMKVTYLDHSGFFVELEDSCLLFDYYRGELPGPNPDKKLLVFVSHAHYDHYNRKIFDMFGGRSDVRFVISSDIYPAGLPDREDIISVGPGEELPVLDASVRTLRSNDEGVAFLVHSEGKTIYHAGDLNWWHWKGEPEAFNVMMRRSYQSQINKLQNEKIDVAFVPVDPRLGEQYFWVLDCFMKRVWSRWVFPMHFWGNYEIFDRLALEKSTEEYRDRIVKIERAGQTFVLQEPERKGE